MAQRFLPCEHFGKVPSLIFFNWLWLNKVFFSNLKQLNICASDKDPLEPTSTQRNLYSVLT